MSLLESLSIGNRGLAAAQMAMHVTGENITNANTEGYSRKRVSLSSDYRTDGSFGQMGFGPNVNSVERLRNELIDRQLNGQVSTQAYSEEVDTAMGRIEDVHQEPSDTGIAQTMDNFWNAWSDLANNPGDKSSREALKSTASVMCERFQYTANQISTYKSDINDQIKDYVGQINDLANQIHNLNTTVSTAEGSSAKNANDARDQRDLALQKLAKIVKISYVEDGNGCMTVTASGSMLVSPQNVFPLDTVRENVKQPDGTQSSFYTTRFQGAQTPFVPQDGKLKALFDVRDNIIPTYQTQLDTVAAAVVKQVNDVHYGGYNLYHMTGMDFFDGTKTTASTMSLSAAVEADSNNIAAAKGGNIVSIVGANVTSVGALVDLTDAANGGNNTWRNLATGSLTLTRTLNGTVLQEGADKDYVVDYELGRIRIVNPAIAAGESFSANFKYNDTGFSGVGDGTNAMNISTIRDQKTTDPDSFGVNTHTLGEFYSGYIGRLGVERAQATSQLNTQNSLVTQMQAQQQQVSGVNLDEEMANLIKYQQSFQASAKFMSTISMMMDVMEKL